MTQSWEPPSDWLRITTIDAHTAGEPLRIFTHPRNNDSCQTAVRPGAL